METKKLQTYRPKWSEPCLCGSGNKYKNCCKHRLPGFDIGQEYSREIKSQNFKKALLAARADVSQYTIWHKTNIAPFMQNRISKELEHLLTIDVNALAAYVDRLHWLYIKKGHSSECLAMLSGVANNIYDIRWDQKIICLRVLFELVAKNDRDRAKQELEKAGPITPNEINIELLQIFIDLNFSNLGFNDRIKYLDRILTISEERSDKIQYQGGKAIQYLLVGDQKTAEELFLKSIAECRATPLEPPLTGYERYLLALNLQTLGGLQCDEKLQEEAIIHYKKLISRGGCTQAGEADLYRGIGDCHRIVSDWRKAEAAYQYATSLCDLPIYQLFKCEAQLYQQKIIEAQNTLNGISIDKFQNYELADYIFIHAELQIKRQEQKGLSEAKKLLEELECVEPMFNERRLNLLVSVSSLLSGKHVNSSTSEKSNGLYRVLSHVLILQPNMFGIGINFNAMIDRFSKKPIMPPNDISET